MAHFNRFDICEAYYLFAYYYHKGQWSREYKILSRLVKMGFKPREGIKLWNLSANAKEIFDRLEEKEDK